MQEATVERECSDRQVRSVLEVEHSGPCQRILASKDPTNVTIGFNGDQCIMEINLEQPDGGECAEQFSHKICDGCPRNVFLQHGCLPRFRGVVNDRFLIEAYFQDTALAREVLEELRSVVDDVTLRQLARTVTKESSQERFVNMSTLTPKQREALTQAYSAGYYDPESSASLTDIATELDISPSAVSERLSRAEHNIMKNIIRS